MTNNSGSSGQVRGARNKKSMWPPSVAIFYGLLLQGWGEEAMVPLPPSRSATEQA